jgi:hypothetical protein
MSDAHKVLDAAREDLISMACRVGHTNPLLAAVVRAYQAADREAKRTSHVHP